MLRRIASRRDVLRAASTVATLAVLPLRRARATGALPIRIANASGTLELALSPERLHYMQAVNVSFGVQSAILPFEQVADMSLAADALKLLGQTPA